MIDECWECGEDPCECEEIAARLEAQAVEEDRALWMSGALEWRDRANDKGFAVQRWLKIWYGRIDRVHQLACSASPMLRACA